MHKKATRKWKICFVDNKYMEWQLDLVDYSLIHSPTQPIDIKECVSSGTAPV